MSSLFYRRYIPVPYARAREYLHEQLDSLANSGEPQILRLAAAIPGDGGSKLYKDVVVTYAHATDPLHFDQPWTLRWHPQSGPFPDFEGELTVRADEDYTSAALELRGNYEPPGGVAGAAFDAIVGSRLASATARELLGEIGRRLTQRFDSEESRKAMR